MKPSQLTTYLNQLVTSNLLHPSRRGIRDRELFNIAADIVVNGRRGWSVTATGSDPQPRS